MFDPFSIVHVIWAERYGDGLWALTNMMGVSDDIKENGPVEKSNVSPYQNMPKSSVRYSAQPTQFARLVNIFNMLSVSIIYYKFKNVRTNYYYYYYYY